VPPRTKHGSGAKYKAMAYETPSYWTARGWRAEIKAETSVKFALMIISVGAEGLDMMRIKDPKICGINQSADEVSAMSAQEK